jgi:pimeloyl-ACP methyl ester carboxylesterase
MSNLPYTWHGAGSPLVLISGLGGKGTSWKPFLGRAAERFRVLTFDLRGSGLAPRLPRGATIRDLAEDVLQLLDKLGLRSAALVGRSMGGMIAQELALLAPERVSSLVLVSTTGRTDRHLASIFELWAHMAETRVPPAVRHRSSLLWCLGQAALEDDALVRSYLEWKGLTDRPDDYAIQARACAGHDALERLGALHARTLVVSGTDDRLTPPAHAEALAKALPRAELAYIPAAGHLPYREKHAEFASLALGFLSGDPSLRGG